MSNHKSDIFDKMGLTSLAKRERGEKIEAVILAGLYKLTNYNDGSDKPYKIQEGIILYPNESTYLILNAEELEYLMSRGLDLRYEKLY